VLAAAPGARTAERLRPIHGRATALPDRHGERGAKIMVRLDHDTPLSVFKITEFGEAIKSSGHRISRGRVVFLTVERSTSGRHILHGSDAQCRILVGERTQ
jgi:hypothetical protein